MDSRQKQSKSWFSSLTGFVSGGRPSAHEQLPATLQHAKSPTSATNRVHTSSYQVSTGDKNTPSFSSTFSAPSPDSPESPAKRASPNLMTQRKIHNRVQGPSARLGTSGGLIKNGPTRSTLFDTSDSGLVMSTPKKPDLFSATTPRNMFRQSTSRSMPVFTFTPRVPPDTLRGTFPVATPGRSFRAAGIELSGREMAKASSSDFFAMKISDPDPKLSGEVVANMIPADLKSGPRSVYANEYLAHLCPPDFNEEQRNQFFCILDLRRLKYAADEVFLKKDWRLNILNFAKEYEKNRSLIMLRYGLYEFKTVKVSKEIFQKWKAANNIPDAGGDEGDSISTASIDVSSVPTAEFVQSRANGTEGILRTGKRKAPGSIDTTSNPDNASTSQPPASIPSKRSRHFSSPNADHVEREPLGETSIPSLNKSKRKATDDENVDQIQRAKLRKPAADLKMLASSPATPSATKVFLEKVANLPAKESPISTIDPASEIPKPAGSMSGSVSPGLKVNGTGQMPRVSSGSLARSVLESGLKVNSNGNIFGYLSDASSVKGSGVDDADADGEETDESEGQTGSEGQTVTGNHPVGTNSDNDKSQPSAPFSNKFTSAVAATSGLQAGSSASSEASETTPGRSLFDRINKGSDGQPLRRFGTETTSTSSAPLFGTKPVSETTDPEKGKSFFSANKTWNPESPIKFAAATSSPATMSLPGLAKPSSASGVPKESSVNPVSNGLGAIIMPETAETIHKGEAGTSPSPMQAKTPAAGALQTSQDPSLVPPASSTAIGQATAQPLFGFLNKSSESTNSTAKPLFSAASQGISGPASLFSKSDELQPSAPAVIGFSSTSNVVANPAKSVLESKALFGSMPKPIDQSQNPKQVADGQLSAASNGTHSSTIIGGSDLPQASKTLFGNISNSANVSSSNTSTPFPASMPSGESSKGNLFKLPASDPPPIKPLFGATEPSTSRPVDKSLGTTTSTSSSIFNFGNNTNDSSGSLKPPTSLLSFGASSNQQQQPGSVGPATTPSFGGDSSTSASSTPASSFTFNVGGGSSQPFRNPFTSTDSGAAATSSSSVPNAQFGSGGTNLFQFGSNNAFTAQSGQPASSFGNSSSTLAGGTPLLSGPSGGSFSNPTSVFGNGSNPGTNAVPPIFSFGAGASSNTSSAPVFGQQNTAVNPPSFSFGPALGGASTGTNTPFTNLAGASSLATSPAPGTPEPGASQDKTNHDGHQADGDEAPQEQISLTEGGPGEEDESVVHEVRAKALKLVAAKDETGSESSAVNDKKSPWKTEGVGPLRVMRHKTTNSVRLLLRAEPRGHVALNRALLPEFTYKPEPNAKYVKLTTANESGTGLETWMLQVKTKEAAQKLAEVFEENKGANMK